MFETLFGSEMPLAARFFIAFLVVLALIGLTAWLVRRFGANRLGGAARGRQPRLAVIDAATIDGRRRLVLIRRDNVEHLLMIGGPTDVVVEPNIVRATGGVRDAAREPARASEPAARQNSNGESTWPLQPVSEPTPVPTPLPSRSSATEEPWLPPEPGARARPADSLSVLAAELSTRLNPPEVAAPAPRSEPAPRPSAAPVVAPPVEPAATPQTDHNLAEMAQQLEAALRRTPMPESRPPVTDPLAGAPAKAASPRDFKPRLEPRFELNREPKIEPKIEPAAGKGAFDNLEEEMASLLGRPSGKT
jgi:flagellar protein FliO/FliZ